MSSGLYVTKNGDLIEFYEGHSQAYNITKGCVESVCILEQADLIEELPDVA